MLAELGITGRELLAWGGGIIPASTLTLLADFVDHADRRYEPSMWIVALSVLAASGSAAFRAAASINRDIMRVLTIPAASTEPRRAKLRRYALSVLAAIAFLFGAYAAIALILLGGALPALRFPLLFCVLFVPVWGVYRVSVPRRRSEDGRKLPPRRTLLPGALTATAALTLTGFAFSVTVEASARYSIVYGSLSALIILMVWLYVCGNILIAGSVLNAVMGKRK
jgi:membrane protein